MASKEEKRLAGDLAGWLEGRQPEPISDPASRAVARTAVLLVDALAPTPLRAETRARLYERALSEASLQRAAGGADGLAEVFRVARQVPGPAWVGLGGVAAGVVVGLALLRQRDGRGWA
ncbi:MAG TPA: hypothetical protein VMV23_11325 [Candidatus Nanopelagicaceae bacterium]|nr:hypothetical protein [Candidatus Nanopelagicaceae bacterium]